VLIYQMLTGRVPFAAETPHGLMYQHLDAEPPLLRTFRPDLPLAVEPVVRKALAKNRADRYASAGELVRDLANALRFPAQTVYNPLPPRRPGDGIAEEERLPLRDQNRPFTSVPRTVTPPPRPFTPPVELAPLPPYQPPVRRNFDEREEAHVTRFLLTIAAVVIGIGILFGVTLAVALLLSPGNNGADGGPTLPVAPANPTDIPAELRPGVVIESPQNNASAGLGTTVTIQFVARGRQGITRVELRRFGQVIDAVAAGGQNTFAGWFFYSATSTGTHTLEVVPWSGDIRGDPATLAIIVQ
jgi:hypothetical protein